MTLRRRVLPVVCLLAAASCSSSTRTAKVTVPAAPDAKKYNVQRAMERHVLAAREVRNAVDAGEGDFEASQLREQLVSNPGDLETRLRLGSRYEALGQPELAIEHYRLATERFPGESAARLRLAAALHRKGRTAEAAAGLESYLDAYPEAPVAAHAWAGILRDALGHHHAAERHHRAALEQAGQQAYLRNNLGQNLALQDRADEAAGEFRAALELEPANLLARNNLAIAISASDPTEAAKVMESGSDDPATAHNNLAAVLIEQGRYPEARKELNLALGYKPDHGAALANLAAVSERDGKPANLVMPVKRTAVRADSAWRRLGRNVARVFTTTETPVERSKPAKPRISD